MFQKLKKKLKDQRGLTLIELLAVIVILGIIAAIAIPSILSIIDNSKKDAHLANAEQLVAASRTAVAQNDSALNWNGNTAVLTLEELKNNGYIDKIENPDGGDYTEAAEGSGTEVTVTKTAGTPTKYSYEVTLVTSDGVIFDRDPSGADRSAVSR